MTQAIPKWILAELENWARYCHSGPWPHPLPPERVASAEGRYTPESDLGAEVEQDEIARRIPVHVENAEIVQSVYRKADRRCQSLMKLRFVHRITGPHLARKMRVSQPMVEAATRTVIREVSSAFALRQLDGRRQFSTPRK